MSRTSLANTKTELYGLLTSAGIPNITGVTAVYPFEPGAGHAAKPVSITISTAGMSVDFYRIQLRLYVSPQTDVVAAQADLDALILAIESKMSSGYGRSDWSVGYDAELDTFVASILLSVGREDAL